MININMLLLNKILKEPTGFSENFFLHPGTQDNQTI